MNMDLPRTCSDALRSSGLDVTVDPNRNGLRIGGVWLLWRELPRGLTRDSVPALRLGSNEILLLPYVNPGLAAALRESAAPFADAAGNAWIWRPPLFVSIEGRKPTVRLAKGRPPLLAGGLQVVFAFLAETGAVNLPYRELARHAGVSVGTVSNTVAWLREQGHVVRGRSGLQVAERSRLRERWELGYLEILRKTLLLGNARLAGKAPIEALLSRSASEVLVGGELAASSMTGHLIPARATLHIREPLAAVFSALKLVPDAAGPVTLLRRFGDADAGEVSAGVQLAHPLLVRAELLASGDARVRDSADRVVP